MKLSGQQRKKLIDALIDAFPTKSSLEQMLSLGLDKNLDVVAGGGNLEVVVFNLIKVANSQGWIDQLIDAACKENPGNLKLQGVAKELLSNYNSIANPARPKNEQILLAAVKEEVTARLRQSLHNAVLINLGKESQPQQVKRPWDAEIKIGLKPAEPLPIATTILEVFDSEEITGKLLILGAPGAGKTTTQLELAQALVSRAQEQPDYPVPVLFNLSSWKDDRQSVTDWLVTELKSKYGVSKKLGQQWVNNRQLIPLLDGLDELEPQRQEGCVQAINQFLASETKSLYLVVCSRIEEYNSYATQLQLKGAILLQPLNNNQIFDYLTSINSIALCSTISNDLDLLELVKTPLLLSISVLASQEISVAEWQQFNSTEDRLKYLLSTYIKRMLTREINSRAYFGSKYPNAQQTQLWLIWLAQQMQQESKTEFLIEKIQPNLLKSKFGNWLYNSLLWGVVMTLMVALVLGLAVCVLYGLFGVNIEKLVNKLIAALLGGLTVGLPFGLIGLFTGLFFKPIKNKIIPVENVVFSWNKFLSRLIISLLIIFCSELIFYIFGIVNNVINEIPFCIFFSLVIGLINGINQVEIKNKTISNEGIWQSIQNSIILSLRAWLIATTLLFIIQYNNNINLNKVLISSVIGGLFFGLLIGIPTSGMPVIQHFILRIILWFNAYIPWNYARFLDYCTERLFLQRVGGRYRFVHKLLQDHFAQMEFRRD